MANGGVGSASRKLSEAAWMIALLRAGMAEGPWSYKQFNRSSINMLFGGISHILDAERHEDIISGIGFAALYPLICPHVLGYLMDCASRKGPERAARESG